MAETALEQKIVEIIEPSLEQLGYELVRIRFMELDKRKVLQVMLDRIDAENVMVEDCEKASHHISALLDVDDPITERYNLEVSSPGIDRPLTRLKDFERFKGLEVKVETKEKIKGRRRFKGNLVGVDGQDILLNRLTVVNIDNPDDDDVTIAFDNIQKAKLVLNNELLATAE